MVLTVALCGVRSQKQKIYICNLDVRFYFYVWPRRLPTCTRSRFLLRSRTLSFQYVITASRWIHAALGVSGVVGFVGFFRNCRYHCGRSAPRKSSEQDCVSSHNWSYRQIKVVHKTVLAIIDVKHPVALRVQTFVFPLFTRLSSAAIPAFATFSLFRSCLLASSKDQSLHLSYDSLNASDSISPITMDVLCQRPKGDQPWSVQSQASTGGTADRPSRQQPFGDYWQRSYGIFCWCHSWDTASTDSSANRYWKCRLLGSAFW